MRGVGNFRPWQAAAVLVLATSLLAACQVWAQTGSPEAGAPPASSTPQAPTDKEDTLKSEDSAELEKTPLSQELPAGAKDQPKDRGELSDLGWTAFWTALVIVAIFACFFLVRRFLPGSKLFFASEAIAVLARRNIAPSVSLFLVQMGRKVVRLGVTRDKISFLGEVSDPDEIAYIRSLSPSAGKESSTRAFESELRTALARQDAAESPLGPEETDKAEIDALRDEISKIRTVIDGWK